MTFARTWLRALPLAAALFASPLVVPPAQAQSRTDAGPTVSAASVGARRAAPAVTLNSSEATSPFQVRRGNGQATALMVVGGIAAIVGILIGPGEPAGGVLLLGGAAVGLYGLYLYLQ